MLKTLGLAYNECSGIYNQSRPLNSLSTTHPVSESSSSKSTLLIVVAKYAVSLCIIAMLVISQKEELLKFFETEKQYHWWVLALATMTASFMFSYVRWHQLANAIDLKLKLGDAIKLGFIGAFFSVIAFGVVGGDSSRAFYATRHSPGRMPEAILSVFIDRVIGLIVMCGFTAVAFLLFGIPGDPSAQKSSIEFGCIFAGCASVAGCLAMLVLVFFPGIRHTRLLRSLVAIPKIGEVFDRVMEAASLYSKRKIVIPIAMLLSLCTNIMFAITIYLVALAIAPDAPTLSEHFVIAPIAMVANSVPLPGGIGGMEAAMAYLYASFDHSSGLLVALGYRLCILFVSLIGWIVWLTIGKSFTEKTTE